jgi:hypothetical protein
MKNIKFITSVMIIEQSNNMHPILEDEDVAWF